MDRKLLSECDFGLSYRYYRLIAPAKEGFMKEEIYSFSHFPESLIIQDPTLRIVYGHLFFFVLLNKYMYCKVHT